MIQTIDAIKDDLTLQKFVMKMASLTIHTNKPLCPDHDDEKDSDKGDDKEQYLIFSKWFSQQMAYWPIYRSYLVISGAQNMTMISVL